MKKSRKPKSDRIYSEFPYSYLHLHLETERNVGLTEDVAREFLEKSLKQLYGLVGGAPTLLKIVKIATNMQSMIVQVIWEERELIETAMLLTTRWLDGSRCRVIQDAPTPFLLALNK